MFERRDSDTMTVIDAAIAEALALGHNWVGTEHLLLGLVQHRDLLPAEVAGLLPADVAIVREALQAELDGPPPRDAELLAALGIDLEAVRAAVGRTFGAEALERFGRWRVHQPWQPWRGPGAGARPSLPAAPASPSRPGSSRHWTTHWPRPTGAGDRRSIRRPCR